MSRSRLCLLLAATVVAGTSLTVDAAQRKPQTAPEEFSSPLQGRTDTGALASTILIKIERYTPEAERQKMTDAMKFGGYPGFLQALRKAPAVGSIVIGDLQVPLRWAREQPTAKGGRAISLVVDSPVYFVGGGRVDAKPRTGFELAVVQLTVDDYGLGFGTMAAAAKVKPDGAGGVLLEDYAEEPIKLTSVHRVIK